MIQHIAGLILFTFIVGTSGAVSALFDYGSDSARSITVRKSYKSYKRKKKRCRKHRKPRRPHFSKSRIVPVRLSQAVFDRTTGRLSTVFSSGSYSRKAGNYFFHFYVNGVDGPTYLRTEKVKRSGNSVQTISDVEWLMNRNAGETIYVIPAFTPSHQSSIIAPRFDMSKAVPVLVKEAE